MLDPGYPIERRYIRIRPETRPGLRLTAGGPAFFVAHDTGNPGATAEAHFRYFDRQTERYASAHVFIDDQRILEIIPTGTGSEPAEKAYHVQRQAPEDNRRFGADANDAALGIELCYGGGIRFEAAYDRYVAYLAYCCAKWSKSPSTHIVSHSQLDPARKRDCEQALATGGRTLRHLIRDVEARLDAWRKDAASSTETGIRPPAPSDPPSTCPAASRGAASLAGSQAGLALPVARLSSDTCAHLIVSYIQPAWQARKAAGDESGAAHYARLADRLRRSADGEGLLRSNAEEIISGWLSPAWFKAAAKGENPERFARMADELRKCAGIPLTGTDL
ncbi:N-acetylmuramoyl-L-alanine amidase [Paenibacillus albicereus]|uniref:N-acetylmuramoyl-L-alanine amidase n=1 Tax=Paenibacillus albicereus TaxID=2726185 RepID=A0A6H2H089_9BACL|nr:N-acetylmuramoyl-L-alanine amidase [Paenibacillus albicereus]QJC53103.1 N-acetylmuramoyl-L-alanine amidase [Paenibacillus albicereus]